MTAELTAEQVVTKLLSSHEILKKENDSFCITNFMDLSDYLKNLPPEEINENRRATTSTHPLVEGTSKYTFIKDGGWKF